MINGSNYRWDGYSTKCAEGEVSVQYPLSLWYSGDKILIMKVNMMVQRFIAMLLMVVLVGLVRAEDAKEVVIASAEELKGIEAKKIIWKKDDAKMVLIPESFARTKDTYTEFGDLVSGKIVKVTDVFYMDTTEVTVGQFKKFLKSSGYKPKEPINWAELYKYSPNDKHPIYMSLGMMPLHTLNGLASDCQLKPNGNLLLGVV